MVPVNLQYVISYIKHQVYQGYNYTVPKCTQVPVPGATSYYNN